MNKKTMKLSRLQRGVTLVELMVAMVITSILLLGVNSIFSNSKRTYLIQEEFSRMQEDARIAMKFLTTDIRMAGYVGCAWNNNLNFENFLDTTNAGYDPSMAQFNVGLEGAEATGTGPANTLDLTAPTAGFSGSAVPSFVGGNKDGSDVIIVRHAAGTGVKLAANKESANFWIEDQGDTTITTIGGKECHAASNICEGDILIVSDCSKARSFQVTSGMSAGNIPAGGGATGIKLVHAAAANPSAPGNSTPSWGGASDGDTHKFAPGDSEIFRSAAYAYYVKDSPTSNEPALFRQELRDGGNEEELVSGVESMQILYGIDTDKTAADQPGDGVANRYVPANLVTPATDNVVSARISILMRTAREIPTAGVAVPGAKDYFLTGVNATNSALTVTAPADRRIRKVFTTTIKIRNKGLVN